MRQTTKIALAWELFKQQTPKIHIAEHLGVHRRTVQRWITGIKEKGDLESFVDAYLMAKKRPRKKRKIDALVKKLIYKIREENRGCCGQKIKYFLKEDYHISLGTTTIYKVLRKKYILRSKWKKNQREAQCPKLRSPERYSRWTPWTLVRSLSFLALISSPKKLMLS